MRVFKLKYYFTAAIAVLAFIHIAGVAPFYYGMLAEAKSEMKFELTSHAHLAQVVVSNADFNNPAVFTKSGDNEFRLHGKMYDYKSVERQADGYVFYALADNQEDLLNGLLQAMFERDYNDARAPHKPLTNMLKNFCPDFLTAHWAPVFHPRQNPVLFSRYCKGKLSQGFQINLTIPPNFVYFA
ncbi:MAG TPA: hypothetical protein VG603_03110 [Chitinophagales bacterium]|nr:hypothetical protein [Chitinophagales bacterium]